MSPRISIVLFRVGFRIRIPLANRRTCTYKGEFNMKKIYLSILLIFIIIQSSSFSQALMQTKWGNSDVYPKTIVMSNGYFQCRYNIQKVNKTDEFGTRTVYDYDYIELKEINRQNILGALI